MANLSEEWCVYPLDNSWCKDKADAMSCDAMLILAKKEETQNRENCKYLLEDPECKRYQQLSDRNLEISLQAYGINRRNCYNPNSMQKEGEWINQFNTTTVDKKDMFDKWTKPRNMHMRRFEISGNELK